MESFHITTSNILNDEEKEKMKLFWKSKAYIVYECPRSGICDYIYKYGDKYYRDGIELYPDELKETDSFSIERIIISAIVMPGGSIRKTKAKKIIKQIKDGQKYKNKNYPITYIERYNYFELGGTQLTFTENELFYFIIENKGQIEKVY